MSSLPLNARKALVTGSAQGIGRAIAERLAEDGAEVVIADINADQARVAAEEIVMAGGKAFSAMLDVSSPESIAALAREIDDVAILVNNAGIFQDTPILETPEAAWARGFDINLFGTIRCIQAFAPGMVRSGWGRIINIGSLMSHLAFGRDIAYAGSKTAILGVTRSVAADLARYGVTVNTVAPGNINTQMMVDVAKVVEERDELPAGSFLKARAEAIPARRLGEPSDVAATVAFLCRNDAGYVNGQTLNVNGALYYH